MTTSDVVDARDIDLTQRSLYRAGPPHEVFTELRRLGPVHRHQAVELPGLMGPVTAEFWSVVHHEQVQIASRDSESFTSGDGPNLAANPLYKDAGMIVALDPPDHTTLRRLIHSGFTPRQVAKLESRIEEWAERILDDVLARGADVIDFVDEIAYQLPMHVIGDIVGIPDSDRPWVFTHIDKMLKSFDPELGYSDADRLAMQFELFTYAQQLSKSKRDNPTDDIWSLLTQVEILDEDGTKRTLGEIELDGFFTILAVAGSETSRNSISQGLMALMDDPEQFQRLRDDPELLPTAADEALRWSTPVLYWTRTAKRDVELGGVHIPAGDRVALWLPSANRDEQVFADPFRFDIARAQNPHVSFGGGGAHYCLGANLAKKEIAVMFGALNRRFVHIEPAGAVDWTGFGPIHNVGVSVNRLPVRLHTS